MAVTIFPYFEDSDHYALKPAHDFLAGEFSKMNYLVIDLLETGLAMNKKEGGERILLDPVHFTGLGGKYLADEIAKQLADSDFLKNHRRKN